MEQLQAQATCKCLKAALGELDHRKAGRGAELNPARLPRELFVDPPCEHDDDGGVNPWPEPQSPPSFDDGLLLSPDLLRSPKGKPPAAPDVSLPPGHMVSTPLEMFDARLRGLAREDPESAALAKPGDLPAAKLKAARSLGRWVIKLAASETMGRPVLEWRLAMLDGRGLPPPQ